jgi:protein-tyrosine phosphatase
MTHAPSTLRLGGPGNFRSLGGLATRDGRRIRHHFLMRSDRLCQLTAEDWQQLAGAGLVTICDLRTVEECTQHPNSVPATLGFMEVACEVRNDLRGDRSLLDHIVSDPTDAGGERMMVEIYRRMPRQMTGSLHRIARRLLEGGAPLLIHCTAGKDRTGFAVAMLLHALGVSSDEILRDYLASRGAPLAAVQRAAIRKSLASMIPADALDSVITPMLDVREVYLQTAFRAVDTEFGSRERYLETAAGLDSAAVERLRELALM